MAGLPRTLTCATNSVDMLGICSWPGIRYIHKLLINSDHISSLSVSKSNSSQMLEGCLMFYLFINLTLSLGVSSIIAGTFVLLITTEIPDRKYYLMHIRSSVDSIINSTDMNSSKVQEIVEDRETWWATIHGITMGQTRFSN